MTCYQKAHCPACGSSHIKKSGLNAHSVQHYRCWHAFCPTRTCVQSYRCLAFESELKEHAVAMALNGSPTAYSSRYAGTHCDN